MFFFLIILMGGYKLGILESPFSLEQKQVFTCHKSKNWSWLLSLFLAAYSSLLQSQTIKKKLILKNFTLYQAPCYMFYIHPNNNLLRLVLLVSFVFIGTLGLWSSNKYNSENHTARKWWSWKSNSGLGCQEN